MRLFFVFCVVVALFVSAANDELEAYDWQETNSIDTASSMAVSQWMGAMKRERDAKRAADLRMKDVYADSWRSLQAAGLVQIDDEDEL